MAHWFMHVVEYGRPARPTAAPGLGRWRAVAVILALLAWSAPGAQAGGVVGSGTAASCTEAALEAALAGGGTVTFDCGSIPVSILITSTKQICADTTIDGGGLVTLDGNHTVRALTLQSNSTLSLENLTVANGRGEGGGGGLGISSGTAIVTNSTFAGNSMRLGGGGIRNSGTLTVTNSTFAGNSARAGGGVSTSIFLGSTTTLRNTIVANSPIGGDCSGPLIDGGHNLDSDGTCGLSAANGSLSVPEPQLAPLANNGGPTETVALCTAAGVPDPSCIGLSAAIDAGDNSACPAADQRGAPRPQDGDGDGTSVCDIGAYEVPAVNLNEPPVCTPAVARPAVLWPPNHKLVPVTILGVSDPNHDQVTLTVMGVTQDEPVNGVGDGDTSPDAVLQGGQLALRAERAGTGNGRVYQVRFTADDGLGGQCTGRVTVCVPHDQKTVTCGDDGQRFNAFQR